MISETGLVVREPALSRIDQTRAALRMSGFSTSAPCIDGYAPWLDNLDDFGPPLSRPDPNDIDFDKLEIEYLEDDPPTPIKIDASPKLAIAA